MNIFTKMLCMSSVVAIGLALATGARAAGSDPVQPRDGLWTGTLLDHETSGCPSMLASRVEAMVPDLMTKSDTKRLQFERPFHPRSLLEDNRHVQWTRVAPDYWRGLMAQSGSAGSGMTAKMTMDLRVLSAKRMRIGTVFTVNLPPQLTAMLGGGSGTCRLEAKGRMDWKSE